VPLPFDAKKLKGLSEKLLVSHHENNYAGALKNLNKVELDLAATTKDTPATRSAGCANASCSSPTRWCCTSTTSPTWAASGKASGAIEKALADTSAASAAGRSCSAPPG
jgi:Fe-Mn family superoxide dismutase